MYFTSIYKSCLLLGVVVLFFHSCSKDSDSGVGDIAGDAILAVSVAGIEDDMLRAKIGKVAGLSGMKTSNASDANNLSEIELVTHTDFDAVLSVEASGSGENNPFQLSKQASAGAVKPSNLLNAATKPMVQGVKYHLILRQKDNGQVVYNGGMTAGTDFKIDVVKGQTYEWVAYSYNNDEVVPAPSSSNLSNATIPTGEGVDLLHAAGEVTVSNPANPSAAIVMPLGIVFKHKLRRIMVELNTMGMFADLMTAEIELADDYFRKGTMTVWSGAVTDSQIITGQRTHTAHKAIEGHSYGDRRAFYFYTTRTADINNFKVNLKRFKIQLDEPGLTREFTAPVTYTFAKLPAGALGQSVTAKIDLVESALTVQGIRWARSNLYYQAGHNPYRYGHMNRLTDNQNSFFGFKDVLPASENTNRQGGDPCMLVYPEKLWRYPTPQEIQSMVNATYSNSNAANDEKMMYDLDVPSTSTLYPDAKLTFKFNGQWEQLLDLGPLGGLGWPVYRNKGTRFEIWSTDKFLDLGWLLDLGSHHLRGSYEWQLIGGTAPRVNYNTKILNEVTILGISLLNGGFKNVRCVRND